MLANQPMRDGMNRLAGVLGRRRRWVLGAWIAIVVVAMPFAARQTEHLTGGGFDVPGSQSKAVAESMQGVFAKEASGVAVLLRAAPSARSPRSTGSPCRRASRAAPRSSCVAPRGRCCRSPARSRPTT
jgi:hypothetical protein